MIPSHEYGKCLENPVNLNSIPASVIFLNNLVTVQGYHIIYHRLGSVYHNDINIDHYEIMTSFNRYDDIYINIYNEISNWTPPEGFLFETFPESMCRQLEDREYPEILGEEDIIEFDEKYVFNDPTPIGFDIEDISESLKLLSPLERVMLSSYGTNGWVENFPHSMIRELLGDHYGLTPVKVKEVLLAVSPRTSFFR